MSGVPKPRAVEPHLNPGPEFRPTLTDVRLTPTCLQPGEGGGVGVELGITGAKALLAHLDAHDNSQGQPVCPVHGRISSHSTGSRWQRWGVSSGGLAPEAGAHLPGRALSCRCGGREGQRPSLPASRDPMLSLEHGRQQLLAAHSRRLHSCLNFLLPQALPLPNRPCTHSAGLCAQLCAGGGGGTVTGGALGLMEQK